MTTKYSKCMANGGTVENDISEQRGGVPEDYRAKTADPSVGPPEPESAKDSGSGADLKIGPRESVGKPDDVKAAIDDENYGNEGTRTKSDAPSPSPAPSPKKVSTPQKAAPQKTVGAPMKTASENRLPLKASAPAPSPAPAPKAPEKPEPTRWGIQPKPSEPGAGRGNINPGKRNVTLENPQYHNQLNDIWSDMWNSSVRKKYADGGVVGSGSSDNASGGGRKSYSKK